MFQVDIQKHDGQTEDRRQNSLCFFSWISDQEEQQEE